jgi:hypothetical protein
MPATSFQKSVTDAGYIAVGLGVMGVQQTQERARKLRARLAAGGDCLTAKVHDARQRFETRAHELRGQVEKRVEPMVGQVQTQFVELPERVVEALEPVAARVRELTGNAA